MLHAPPSFEHAEYLLGHTADALINVTLVKKGNSIRVVNHKWIVPVSRYQVQL